MKKALIFIITCLAFASTHSQITKEEREWLIKKTLNDLVFVEGGTFMMGDVGYTDSLGNHQYFSSGGNSLPVHQVTLDSYSMGKLEVTFKEFDLFCKATGRSLVGKMFRNTDDVKPQLGAIWLDWYQAKAYCEWLFKLTGLMFDLPTDAQWEYAARSRGNTVAYATDNGKKEAGRNFKGKEYRLGLLPPPGKYPPNPLGIYNMSDNNSEWVLDTWYPYNKEPKTNPMIHEGGALMVVRGWQGYPVTDRGYRKPSNNGAGIGIRFVVNKKEPIDANAELKRFGIPPISQEEKEAFMPVNWVVEEEE